MSAVRVPRILLVWLVVCAGVLATSDVFGAARLLYYRIRPTRVLTPDALSWAVTLALWALLIAVLFAAGYYAQRLQRKIARPLEVLVGVALTSVLFDSLELFAAASSHQFSAALGVVPFTALGVGAAVRFHRGGESPGAA